MNATAPAAASAVTPLQAYQQGTLGFSFSGAGFMMIYYVGVVKVLQTLGIIGGDAPRPIAGASSGGLVTASMCSGVTHEHLYKVVRNLTDTCAKKTCAGHMDAELRHALGGMLPPDAAAKCNGRGYVSVSALPADGKQGPPEGVLVSQWEDKQDVINTLAASAFIPGWSDAKAPAAVWRGRGALDGGFTLIQPCPARGAEGYCVKIANAAPEPHPSGGGFTIEALKAEIARAAAGPRPVADGVAKPPPLPAAAQASPARVAAMKARGPDIAPGLSVDIPYSYGMINELSLLPCGPHTCDYLYQLGQLDAMTWAETTGIKAAAEEERAKRQAAAAAATAAPSAAGSGAAVAGAGKGQRAAAGGGKGWISIGKGGVSAGGKGKLASIIGKIPKPQHLISG